MKGRRARSIAPKISWARAWPSRSCTASCRRRRPPSALGRSAEARRPRASRTSSSVYDAGFGEDGQFLLRRWTSSIGCDLEAGLEESGALAPKKALRDRSPGVPPRSRPRTRPASSTAGSSRATSSWSPTHGSSPSRCSTSATGPSRRRGRQGRHRRQSVLHGARAVRRHRRRTHRHLLAGRADVRAVLGHAAVRRPEPRTGDDASPRRGAAAAAGRRRRARPRSSCARWSRRRRAVSGRRGSCAMRSNVGQSRRRVSPTRRAPGDRARRRGARNETGRAVDTPDATAPMPKLDSPSWRGARDSNSSRSGSKTRCERRQDARRRARKTNRTRPSRSRPRSKTSSARPTRPSRRPATDGTSTPATSSWSTTRRR